MISPRAPLLLPSTLGLSLVLLLVACEGGREAAIPTPSSPSVPPATVAADDPYAQARALYAARAERLARAEAGR